MVHLLNPWGQACLLVLATVCSVHAIGQDTCVSFQTQSSSSSFSVINKGQAAPILVSADEWPGVQRAASDFVSDIQKVSGVAPRLSNATASTASANLKTTTPPILVGTLGKSSLIEQIVNRTHLDVSSIDGKWEAFLAKVVENPLPGIEKAYVIIGADKRGTIFALYDHSEQFGGSVSPIAYCMTLKCISGVSPWYW